MSKQIAAMYDGVSQQPSTVRLPSQCESQVNAWSTVVQGVMKRPPTQHVANLGNISTSAYIHIANRSTTERYIMVFTNGSIQVYDFNGTAKTVSFPSGTGYLATGGAPANEVFVAVTVGDTTFVLNKTVTIQAYAALGDENISATKYTDISGQGGGDASFGSTDGVPTKAYTSNPSTGLMTGPPNAQVPLNPASLVVTVYQSFEALPGIAANTDYPVPNTVYKIAGDSDNNFGSYFVIYQNGAYDETLQPGMAGSGLVETTMPWALSRGADGTFIFQPIAWAPRRVGDDSNNNPPPSFVNSTAKDLVFYQNRLGLVHDEGVVFSQAGYADNFYRLTVTEALDDQVIDIQASDNEVTDFYFAVPFATGMMFFSDQTQFRLLQPSDGELTSTSVGLNVSTRFIASTTVRPVMLGPDVYFISEDDTYAHLREYYVILNYLGQYMTDATDVSAHVPSYIPKGVYQMSGSLIHDALFISTTAFPNRIYVYKYQWADDQDRQKTQESWNYWDMGTGDTVMQTAALDDYLWMIVYRSSDGAAYLEKMSLAIGANVGIKDTKGNYFDLLMDRRVLLSSSTVPPSVATDGTGHTILTFPYNPTAMLSAGTLQVVNGTTGALLDLTGATATSTTVSIPGNVVGNYYAGTKYTFTYEFSTQYMRDSNNVALLTGRMTLRNWWLYFDPAAVYTVTVDPYSNGMATSSLVIVPAEESAYDALTVSEAASVTDAPVFKSGDFQFGVYAEAKEATITISNDTPYPSIFYQASLEFDFTDRSRNM